MKTQNRIQFVTLAALLMMSFVGFAQDDQETKDQRTFQVSFVPPLGTNGHDGHKVSNKISFNILAGYSRGVESVEVGGLYNIVKENVNGLQISGFGNSVGGNINGFQMGGFLNTTRGNVNGSQIGGFLNILIGDVEAAQIAGFANISGHVHGAQVGGFYNQNRGTQGAQVGGFINITKDLKGAQASGFINIAKEVRGVQLGVINISDSVASGAPVGLVNIVKKDGFISPGIESDEAIPYRLTFRSGLERFYTVLSVGINPDDYWSYGAGFGSRMYLTAQKKVFLNPELRFHNINEGKIKANDNSHLVKLNMNVGFQAFNHLYITAGPTVNFYFTNNLDENGQPVINLVNNPSLDDQRGRKRYQMWIGYSVGIGF